MQVKCLSCGASQINTESLICTYCGSIKNDNSQNVLIEDVEEGVLSLYCVTGTQAEWQFFNNGIKGKLIGSAAELFGNNHFKINYSKIKSINIEEEVFNKRKFLIVWIDHEIQTNDGAKSPYRLVLFPTKRNIAIAEIIRLLVTNIKKNGYIEVEINKILKTPIPNYDKKENDKYDIHWLSGPLKLAIIIIAIFAIIILIGLS